MFIMSFEPLDENSYLSNLFMMRCL